MQEKNRNTQSYVMLGIKLIAAVLCAMAIMLLLTMPGTGICLLLDAIPHETVFPWIRIPLFLVGGYVAGRIFASSCSLKGIVCGILTTLLFSGILLIARTIPDMTGNHTGSWVLSVICFLISSVLGSVVSACRRS